MTKKRKWKEQVKKWAWLLLGMCMLVFGKTEKTAAMEGCVQAAAWWQDAEAFTGILAIEVQGGLEEFSTLEVWLSEYILPDWDNGEKENWMAEEIPIYGADGRETTITHLEWKENGGENKFHFEIPVRLREEYATPLSEKVYPVCDPGKGILVYTKAEGENLLFARAEPPYLTVLAAESSVVLFAEQLTEKQVGTRILCEVTVSNNGQVPFEDLQFSAEVEGIDAEPVWEKAVGAAGGSGKTVLEYLGVGESRTLQLYVDGTERKDLQTILRVSLCAQNPVILKTEKQIQLVLPEKTASFEVHKTADREIARPGDTVTYQISIHNTGNVTLHSVITTEKFGLAGVTASFLPQENVLLNESKTKAKISEIAPGGCVNLKAQVVLPEKLEDQDLTNQVLVSSLETGEEDGVLEEAVIKVENEKSKSGLKNTGGTADYTSKSSPQTGDRSHKELFEVLLLVSVILSAAAAGRMFFGRKD